MLVGFVQFDSLFIVNFTLLFYHNLSRIFHYQIILIAHSIEQFSIEKNQKIRAKKF